ncbi:tRNA isopentenyltransferase MiaA [Desulfitobacterium dichloroeliminans LMG P-21439]|uniref:tRNA dimethylallyltransferase n=1 Tax=Desulfitobacterium dichloroeliminans (strain LMG P-21439 / DCA1) TaxID=871963 RepID=L0F8E5_DESDL|nr:tRNA (adenosine(37)-N6)-dimethylallyltransferase MiaA [Desulfitobacterium dichloroeliminans]AGA69310.1 tRNA isopentenyltransferase MiaA [Desulfitobacterium dichloroeliminans LMG P-21439]
MKPLVIIVGPTAVGKTALSVALAQALQGEVISGDSVQVYRKLDIGSAKPSLEEQGNVPHYLLDILDPREPFSVAQFQDLAQKHIQDIRIRGKVPIVVGGTGLYIRSLLDPFGFAEHGSESIRKDWYTFLTQKGKEALHSELENRDPLSAQRLHPNDTVRIIRALEMCQLTGKPFSEIRGNQDTQYSNLDPSTLYVGLTAPREIIYERINLRCEQMLASGLIEETHNILKEGYSPHLKPLQSIGYRHALHYLYGKVTRQEMLRIFQRDTRHFAKRQLTWFRRDPRIIWHDTYNEKMSNIIESLIDTCSAIESRVK